MSLINKIIHISLFAVLLLFFCGQVLFAQQDMIRCKEQVHTIYSAFMSALAAPDAHRGMHMNYTMDVLDAMGKHTEATFDVYVLPGQMRMIAKEIEMYSDEKILCTVLPLSRQITLVPASPASAQNAMQSMNIIQDSLLALATVSKCLDHTAADGTMETEVFLSLKEKKVPGIESLEFFFDSQKLLLRKMVIHYPAGNRYRQVALTYHTLDYSYTNSTMVGTSVENIIFSAPNVLRPAYKDFTVYDTRKQPTRKP